MSALRWAAPAVLLLGVALIVAAVATGAAHVELVAIVPVIVGGSALFAIGILALFLGIGLLAIAFQDRDTDPLDAVPAPLRRAEERVDGLLLIGPLPIFFGSWKNAGRRAYWIAAGVGLAVLVMLVVIALVFA